MSNISEIKRSFDNYLETRDEKYIGEIIGKSEYIVVAATKNALKNYNMDEDRYEDYVGFGYIKIANRIMKMDERDWSSTELYRYLYTTVTSEMTKQLEIEKQIEENTIPLHLLDKRMSQLERMGLVDDFSLERGEEKTDLEIRKKVLNKVLNQLNEKQRKMVEMYFGFDDGKQKSLQDVADILGVQRGYVFYVIGRSLIKMRTYVYKKGNKSLRNQLLK
jgi:RNA polymerase sigma factor (sigma-70 family)